MGECRRFPPAVVSRPDTITASIQSYSPSVMAEEWCGEWRALACGAVQPAFSRVCVLPVEHADGAGKKTAHRDSGGHRWFS
jgi:hypothetical protein